MQSQILLSCKSLPAAVAPSDVTSEGSRTVDFLLMALEIPCIGKVFGFAGWLGTLEWSDVFIHVFSMDCQVSNCDEETSIFTCKLTCA